MLQSCGGLDDNEFIDADEQARLDDADIIDYLETNGISATKNETTGIYIRKDVSNSSGENGNGKICGIYYTASILGQEPFDEHTEADGESILMKQGGNAVIPIGMDFVVGLMSVGETFTFYLPSQEAYGQFTFADIIPANALIEMTVTLDRIYSESELLSLETSTIDDFIEENDLNDLDENPVGEVETLATGVRFKLLNNGQGSDAPATNQVVGVKYKGSFLDGKIFDQTQGEDLLRYRFGTNAVIAGFDAGVAKLEEGDKCLVIIPSNSAYAQSVRVVPPFIKPSLISNMIIPGYVDSIDPYSILLFEIELIEIQ
ncbi:MAG: FKBP-type peptidyl-prolyl cis-trans isomerase [Cyclobacteriaceae bacterium]